MNYFDCHVDTLTAITKPGETFGANSGALDLRRVKSFADKYAQIFAIYMDEGELDMARPEEQFYQAYKRASELLENEKDSLVWCKNAADMEIAHEQGKAAAFLSIEDVAVMGSHVEHIKELGIRFALLTWNYDNRYACGASCDQKKGLKAEGRNLVEKFVKEGIVLDISHLSDKGAEDIFNLTDVPVMASHSNIRTLCPHPRNLTPELAKELIRRKGLIGINFYGNFIGENPDMMSLMRHMDAVLEMGGEDVLALGTDFDGCSILPKEIEGVQSIPLLYEFMGKNGFDRHLLDKIFFENAHRFVLENVK